MDINTEKKQAPIVELSQELEALKINTDKLEIPKEGWIYKIRTTCKMPLKYIAKKANVTIEAIKAYEKSEALDSDGKRKISIATLEKAAAAMDMKLIYFMVPRSEKTLLDDINAKLQQYEEERSSKISDASSFQIKKPPQMYYSDIPKSIWDEPKPIFKKIDLSALVKPQDQSNPG